MSEQFSINTAQSGFYQGFNTVVAVTPKVLVLLLIIWTISSPQEAETALLQLQNWSTSVFSAWYMYCATAILVCTILLAIVPKTGRIKLGRDTDRPEFSRFSWFSMMFGAGIGIGMLTYSTAEPIFHFSTNPDVILGSAESLNANNVRNAFRWSFFHYALTPWSFYAVIGISLGYFSYAKGLPLTIRSALYPIFGKSINGALGHVVDIVAILATIIGVGVTIGYGVSQFASGVFNISSAAWIVDASGTPTFLAQLLALILILFASTISAMSGVNKGIKWLSNLNMSLSVFLLVFFVFVGALTFAVSSYGYAVWDYLIALPVMSVTVWESTELSNWQSAWTVFYWAWWIAFAPFVGLFLARVSRGRTIREYVVGAVIVPSLTCLTWFALVGGTAIDLELSGVAQGRILNADISAQLFQTINLILSPELAAAMSAVIVVLLLTYLITTVDSAILIVTTLASAGDQGQKHTKHIIIWGIIFTAVIASLLAAGGMAALRSVMIIGALPFSFVLILMQVSLIKSLLLDHKN